MKLHPSQISKTFWGNTGEQTHQEKHSRIKTFKASAMCSIQSISGNTWQVKEVEEAKGLWPREQPGTCVCYVDNLLKGSISQVFLGHISESNCWGRQIHNG